MPRRMALRYFLSLGIMGAAPLLVADQAIAESTSISTQKSLLQGVALGVETGAPSLSLWRPDQPEKLPPKPVPSLTLVGEMAPITTDRFTAATIAEPEAAYGLAPSRGLASDAAPSLDIAPAEGPHGAPESMAGQPPEESTSAPLEVVPADPLPAPPDHLPEESTSAPLQVMPVDPLLTPAERSEVFTQAAFLQQGDETSARLRGGGIYVLSPSVFVGATVDLSTGESFSDTDQTGLSLNELYLTASPANLPELRFSVGLLDLTAYLDRNSFAKDSVTQFFNPVFQTNPALSTVNVASRPAALVNWTPVDELSLTATTYSSHKGLGDFSLDSFAGEVGLRLGNNAIVRGTYVTSRDSGQGDGFQEIFTFDRGNGQFGPLPGDREESFGLNAEVYIPEIKLGLFGRYGWYTNVDLGASGQTYSLGVNGLDVFLPNDRLGLGYGRQLSNDNLRQASGGTVPDVWELFYDAEVVDNLRVGVSLQQRDAWTSTYLGVRLRYDLRWTNLVREGQ
jgi:hypothetical protein